MKLHQLQALIAVADHGGIRSAARALALSQAAITRALRELEQEQGLALLARHAGGARLTTAGLTLLPHARQIASQLEKAQRDLASLRGETPSRLCVGITPWFGQTLLGAALQAFRQAMPAVQLELYEGLQAVSLSLLRSGQMQFALGPAGGLPAQEFSHQVLAHYPMQVLARIGHPLQEARSLGQLLEHDWVMNFTQTGQHSLMQQLFGRHGLDLEPGRIVCAQSSAMLSSLIIDAGMLGYSPAPMLLCEPLRDKARALALDEPLEEGDISVIQLRDQVLDPAARCFVRCLQQALKACCRSRSADDRRLADMLRLCF
ncbi:LysR substrate-binding domain-containing protein [Pseudomonas guariconensis]|uniref:LysR family transcriptional regulator n=1 Tax=Pseudomonas TaxID=286 RepID=UPI001CE496C4|nr:MULTISPECIES: LysR substrate-binding domain-containing protein [Pseudomonas]MCO7513812.1 LysR substrate-binding domain-containing protein [Pseudomonas putida]MCO7595512.1 LysR substrate-binding domain-containing protein [Pseudomonas guariconensis]MCO7605385.1 LysR substrate-binding domain-containing protein [Pseudomonas guariconensis]MCO7632887.1 LysR substrate-binding domain-containing protein [Pseudomonas guariconensis]MCU7220520.1 LysR substrate-binding domain-containing protein [Pseudom